MSKLLGERDVVLDDITLIKAQEAIRKQDYDQGIALARQVFPDNSTSAADHLVLGDFYAAAGQSGAAGKEFRRAVELGPGLPGTWLSYVRYLVQGRQIDQARTTIEAARKALPASQATLPLAECWIAVRDFRQAEALIGKALNEEGKSADPNTLKTAAIVALGQDRRDKVDDYLNKLDGLANLSTSDRAWVNRVRVSLLNAGRLADQDQALGLIEENLKTDPSSVEDLRLKATLLARRPSRRVEALRLLEPLESANRLDANEQFLLAQLYLAQHDEQKYQDEMFKLLKSRTRSPQHLAHFVRYWIGQKQFDQADRWLGELKKTEPRGVAALELEASLLDLRKRRPQLLTLLQSRGREVPDQIGIVADLLSHYGFAKEAEAAYKAFAARDPKQPERMLPLAQFLARQDRAEEAMAIFQNACRTCPPEQVAATSLSLYDAPSANETQKRQVEAWTAQAVQSHPDSAMFTSNLAGILIRQARFDEAEALCRRALASNPDNAGALNTLAWLLALRDQGKGQEAIEHIDRAIEIVGENPSLLDTRAVARISAGQAGQAVEELLALRRQAPWKLNFVLHLAWAYQAKGQTEQARTELQDAEKLGLKPQVLDPLELAVLQRLRKELFPG